MIAEDLVAMLYWSGRALQNSMLGDVGDPASLTFRFSNAKIQECLLFTKKNGKLTWNAFVFDYIVVSFSLLTVGHSVQVRFETNSAVVQSGTE